MKVVFAVGLLLILACSSVGAADSDDEERSVLEDWRETLLYGIDEEVVFTLEAIRAADEQALNPELVRVFSETLNNTVKIEILKYMGGQKVRDAEEPALIFLAEWEDLNDDMVIALVRYLAEIESSEVATFTRDILDHQSSAVASAAIRALRHDPEAGELLLQKLQDDSYPEELKPELILALGAMAYQPAYVPLAEIVEDTSRDKVWRMYAADSLGKIGNPEAVPVLKQLFSENDALLRAYAAAALSHYEGEDVGPVLAQALKDGNWRVRVTAATAMGERKESDAVPMLIYKARRDPVLRVRVEAIKALGQIGSRDALDALRDLYGSPLESYDIRTACLDVLVDKDIGGTIGTIKAVLDAEWGKQPTNNRAIQLTAGELATAKSPMLKEIYERMLGSANLSVRIAAIRGVGHNGFGGLRDRLQTIAEADPVAGVRKEALRALDRL